MDGGGLFVGMNGFVGGRDGRRSGWRRRRLREEDWTRQERLRREQGREESRK
jgi:hypothetical protein